MPSSFPSLTAAGGSAAGIPDAEWGGLLEKLPVAVFQLSRSASGAWSVPYAGRELRRLLMLRAAVPPLDAALLLGRIHADDRQRLHQQLALSRWSGRPWKSRFRVDRPEDGEPVWLEASAAPQVAFNGGTLWHGVVSDVTAEQTREQQLRELQARWSAAAGAAGFGVVAIDLGSNGDGAGRSAATVTLDAIACRHHGIDDVEQIRLPLDAWLRRFAEHDRLDAHRALTAPPPPDGAADALLLRHQPAGDGDTRTLEFMLRAGSTPQRRVGTCRDVTPQQTREAQRRDKLAAEQVGRSTSALLARVSHELRTPLNGILGFAALMTHDAEQPLPVAQRGRLDRLQQSAVRLLEMVDRLLEVADADGGRTPLRAQAVDLAPLIERSVAALAPLAAAHGVTVAVDVEAGAAPVQADPQAVAQVLDKLLRNAVQYNRRDGRVWLHLRTAGDQAVLAVDDSGVGIDEARLARLFEPFERLGAERGAVPGKGLSLALARRLVQSMGGTLRADSQAGQGSRFVVTLPLLRSEPPAATAAGPAAASPVDDASSAIAPGRRAAPPPVPAGPPDIDADADADADVAGPATAVVRDGSSPKIVLYIEDDEINTLLMEQIFMSLPDFRLVTATSGAQGLVAAVAHAPSLILLDLNMPEMSGHDVLLRLKADPRTRDIRCIALSAEVLPQQIADTLAAGFDDYWTKPVDVADILERLRAESRTLDATGTGGGSAFTCL